MSGMTSSSNDLNRDFLLSSVSLSQELLSDIFYQINTIGPKHESQDYSWNDRLSRLTSDLSLFVELTTLLAKGMVKEKHKTIPQIKESHIHLLFIIKAINQAHQKQDIIALEELIKYELKDNLTQWKINIISQIKRILNA